MPISGEISAKLYIAVEGIDEVNFLYSLLKHINIPKGDIVVDDYRGKNNLREYIPALKLATGFDNIKTLIVFRDADDNNDAAFQSVRDCLRRNNLPYPDKNMSFSGGEPNVGIFIMPGLSENGMLETLCLKSLDGNPLIDVVNSYIETAVTLQKSKNSIDLVSQPKKKWNIDKAKCQAYLAVMPEIVSKVGEGAQKGYWDFDSETFNDLIKFLKNVC